MMFWERLTRCKKKRTEKEVLIKTNDIVYSTRKPEDRYTSSHVTIGINNQGIYHITMRCFDIIERREKKSNEKRELPVGTLTRE
ncbi:hypothetical protein V1477_014357 [Vespula maculifrons]|uniref:Uncharacterized protein n=1 Tax=Vespula maculifrons TaxID=7453 RepID=A0ABD2BKT7_VESMC